MATNRNSRSQRPVFGPARGVVLAILSSLAGITGCPTKPTPTPVPTPPDYKPQPVIDIERIQPFRLEQSFQYDWRRERPDVRSGLLVVFKVDPKLVTPRNELEPVLYAGNHTVQRLNQGHESGFVIGIVPDQIDLSREPVWFGTPALPERIDKETIARERDKAATAGIAPLAAAVVQSRTEDPVVVPDLTTLLREHAAKLVLEFSPQEKPLADAWRLAVTG